MLRTLPRSGRIACRVRSRPCLAEPPAESPSTMKISLSRGAGRRAVAQLAGQVEPVRGRRLPRHLLLRRPAGLAGPCGEHDAGDDRLGDRDVVVEPVLERRTHQASRPPTTTSGLLSRSFVCPWNCGSGMNTLSTPTSPSRMSSAVSVTPFGVSVCVSMKFRTALTRPPRKPVLVRPARAGRDAVDVAADVLVGRLGPLQRQVEAQAVVSRASDERPLVHGRGHRRSATIFRR